MKDTIRIIAASAFVTALLIKAVPALADPVQPQNISVVQTADLNLASVAGKRELDRRLSIAAGEVCGIASDVDPAGKNAVRRCRDEAIAKARSERDSMLAAADKRGVIAISASR